MERLTPVLFRFSGREQGTRILPWSYPLSIIRSGRSMVDKETRIQPLAHGGFVLVQFNAAGQSQARLNYDRPFSLEEAEKALELFERTAPDYTYEIHPYVQTLPPPETK